MTRYALVAAGLSFLAVSKTAQTPAQAPQAPPVFRGGTEIVALDVTVLDNNRLPVRGLAQSDFTITEDGQPQRIVAFDAVDLPDRIDPPAKWMVNVTPDIATNSMNDSRLFVMVMDDSMMGEARALQDAKKIAHKVIDQLGPADLMAIVFPRDNRHTQDFTSDHTKLGVAVDHFTMGFTGMGKSPNLPLQAGAADVDAFHKQSSIDTVAAAAEFLGTVPDRRKILVYVSPGVGVPIPESVLMGDNSSVGAGGSLTAAGGGSLMAASDQQKDLEWRASELVRLAREANVAVYTIDPCGLRVASPIGGPCQPGEEVTYLQGIAVATGGHATVNTNSFDAGINGLFKENASYYLIGYRSTSSKPSSSTRRVDVKVSRPGVEIKFRHTYRPQQLSDPVAATRATPAKPGGPPEQSANAVVNLSKALTGILPTPDMPLQVALAPFAIPGKKDVARVAIILGLRQPTPESGAGNRVVETIDLQTKAFTPEGQPMGSSRQIAKVTLIPIQTNEFRFEVLSQIDLKPGRYQLRLAAYRDTLKKSASVYGDVVVPDFASEKVSLSGVVLTSMQAPVAAGQESLKSLLPVVPTSERTFRRGEDVTVFCRAYQGKGKLAPLTIQTHVVDAADHVVGDSMQTLGLDKIDASTRAGDIRFQLPIAQLPAGPYNLSIEAFGTSSSAKRDVRFTVR